MGLRMSGPRDLVLDRLRAALTQAGRPLDSAHLIAVSKMQSPAAITSLANQGQRDFGENYAQEFLTKRSLTWPEGTRWHFIGHLQKNKIKSILGLCHRIHSADSVEMIETLAKRAADAGVEENILIQVNVSGESSKDGLSPARLDAALEAALRGGSLRIRGLMTMPPLQNEPEENRAHFRALRELVERARARYGDDRHTLDELSMGTSHDFEVAAEEGASWIRVGTLLFGERAKK